MAQYPDQTKDKPQDKAAAKADTVTITGCVADKDAKGHFMLNNAAPGASAPASPTASAATGSSYVLSGGGDLKAHVGHKVEVTGTIEAAKAPKPDDAATGTSGTTKAPTADTLKVKSVKMVAETCQ